MPDLFSVNLSDLLHSTVAVAACLITGFLFYGATQ